MVKKAARDPERRWNMEGRPRGGASLPCPECAGNTEVIITRRKEDKVLRQRKCLKRRCGAKFQSVEQVL